MGKSLIQRWFGGSASHKEQSSADLPGLMQKAQEAFAAGDHATAADALQRALALDPGQTDAHRFLAAIHRAKGQGSEAEKHYRLACAANPDDESLHLDLCTLLVEQHRLNEAREAVSQALLRLPASANLHFYMGNLQQALGKAEPALASWRASLSANPDQIMVLRNMGLALLAQGDAPAAADALRHAAALAPDWAEGHNNLGQAELQRGNTDAAIARFEQAAALDPAFAPAHANLGEAWLIKGDQALALAAFAKAVASDPEMQGAHLRMAAILFDQGRHDDAERACREARQIAPDNIDALILLGRLLMIRKEFGEALSCFSQVTAQHASHAVAQFCVGEALMANALQGESSMKKARLAQAEAAFKAALTADPSMVQAEFNLGAIHIEREELDAANAIYEKLLSSDANTNVGTNVNAATVRHNLGMIAEERAKRAPAAERTAWYDTAIAHYQAALAIDGKQAESLINIAYVYQEQMRFDEAIASYRQALALVPGNPTACMNFSLLQLTVGDFAQGWRNYESRWDASSDMKRMLTPHPHWDGSADLRGRTILLYHEQGLGDSLQFIRYAGVLADLGATVWVLVPPPLQRLFANCPGVSRVFGETDTIPPPDFVCPLLSLPLALKTDLASIPADVPYLRASEDGVAHWRDKLGPRQGLRVGLVWAGEARKDSRVAAAVNNMRSLHFDQFRPFLAVPGVEFYSVQVGKDSAAQLDPQAQVIDHTQELSDFHDTAALAANLDLAICVDTSTAHLFGGVGKPVWMLNRYNTCWRWMLDRQDSPWYPTMRIFRQPRLGVWEPVIAEIKAALEAEVKKQAK